MKYCPQCQKQFTENWITFCSEDGTILIDTGYTPSSQPPPPGGQGSRYAPPYAEPRDWRSPDPNAPGSWVPPGSAPPVGRPAWQPPPPPSRQQPSQGLAVASMVVGLLGFVAGFCFGPIPGIIALILGFVALSQINKAPDKNGGKPFAIIGIVFGGLSVLFFGLWLLFILIGGILGG